MHYYDLRTFAFPIIKAGLTPLSRRWHPSSRPSAKGRLQTSPPADRNRVTRRRTLIAAPSGQSVLLALHDSRCYTIDCEAEKARTAGLPQAATSNVQSAAVHLACLTTSNSAVCLCFCKVQAVVHTYHWRTVFFHNYETENRQEHSHARSKQIIEIAMIEDHLLYTSRTFKMPVNTINTPEIYCAVELSI